MSLRNNITIVSSTVRAINKAKATGKLSTKEIFSFSLVDYLIEFINETIANGSTQYITAKADLLLLLRELVYRNPDTLCNYKSTNSLNNTNVFSSNNTAPTVSGITIPLEEENSYTFKSSDFTTGFTDAQRDTWKKLIIYPITAPGTLTYRGNVVTTKLEIKVSEAVYLVYTRASSAAFSNTLDFRVGDSNAISLYSAITTNTLTGTEVTESNKPGNSPATLGDNIIYVDNRVTTVLTLAMFTTLLSPPYNDPDGDLIDAIRIDSIAGTNTGAFYYNGIEIGEGTILTREELALNLFTHIGPDTNSLASDIFTFSARDEGSLVWVQ